MTASAVLNPLNWRTNALSQFHVPLGKLTKVQRVHVDATVSAFHLADSDDAEKELVELEVYSGSSITLLSKLTDKVEVEKGKHKVMHVSPHGHRIGIFNNKFGEKYPVCMRAVITLLSMPVTACSAERN
jgi:hypothetical protein